MSVESNEGVDNSQQQEEQQTQQTETKQHEDTSKQSGNEENHKPSAGAKYTDDDVDRIVKSRLARAEADKQKAVDEAQKLGKMNSDQKREYELKKAQKALEETKHQLATFNMSKQARKMFEDEKISVTEDDLQHIVTPEADTTKANVKWLVDHDNALADRIRKELLKGRTPRSSANDQKLSAGARFASQRNKQSSEIQDPWQKFKEE